MPLIDTHTHLYLPEFDPDRDEVIREAIAQGISRFFLPNIDRSSVSRLLDLCGRWPDHCFPMMGLHPCSVKEGYAEELKAVEDWLCRKRFYAIGEIGIDLFWDKSFFEQQQDAFRFQVKLAKQHGLPVVIHTRNAFAEAYEIISGLNDETLKGIFHCFSGTKEEADKVIALGGFKLGIGGVLTFKNAGLDKVVTEIDLAHMVLETDAPYLAPVPHRGKRNESAYLLLVARKLAELKNISLDEVAEVTGRNAKDIFNI